jgi:hypothetical protein
MSAVATIEHACTAVPRLTSHAFAVALHALSGQQKDRVTSAFRAFGLRRSPWHAANRPPPHSHHLLAMRPVNSAPDAALRHLDEKAEKGHP